MWGQIFLEASIQQNFNFGFSTHKSDILIHLSQWQYWWWFWFSLVWVVYYYVIVTDSTKRTLTFNPVLNTSLRSHGKWGDFLVALIPLSWCGNILVNSNFILRIIEWQNESSLFTLRIQGKQWYWVYKYDGNAAVMIDSAPKNVGHDRWLVTTNNESYTADSYYQALHLAAQLEFQDMYKTEISKVNILKKNLETSTLYANQINITTDTPVIANNLVTNNINYLNIDENIDYPNTIVNFKLKSKNITLLKQKTSKIKFLLSKTTRKYQAGLALYRSFLEDTEKKVRSLPRPKIARALCDSFSPNFSYRQSDLTLNTISLLELYSPSYQNTHYDLLKLDDTQNAYGNMRVLLANNPIILHAGILNDHIIDILQSNIKMKTSVLFTTSVNNNNIELKVNQTEDLWGFRQKRYKRLKDFQFSPKLEYDHNTFEPLTPKNQPLIKIHKLIMNKQIQAPIKPEINTNNYVGNLSYRATVDQPYTPTTLDIQKTQTINSNNAYYFYSSLKLNKKRSEVLSVNLARRLLRTKRTLVLPAHVNITVITNSYDVVHSWFIPGLGLKLDCVPGRSTHHTLYVDNVGFYYGQCAEICGRYHHHMPIRVCAIPFEQFLVWWHTKGLPRTLRLHQNKNLLSNEKMQPIIHKAFIQYRYNF
uniref:Cytochrome c oxidase polypeptide II n=1 Tax=Thuricola similis TaxID=2784598 RepID=A0A7T8G443_9CILI|nr:cytochrome c oxidase subunit 2 [Thuricola similis]QQP22140.1 cytochrome c oxidase subunit 2 [Thuricola similis]